MSGKISQQHIQILTFPADEDKTEKDPFSFKAAAVLSQLYAKFQAKAGETVGVKPGAAWREALEAASEHGGKQVKDLNDKVPTPLTLASVFPHSMSPKFMQRP